MIGTIFLWIMWPSFNAITTTDGQRIRAIANTFVSLCGAVVATFFMSALTKRKLDMVHVQNSTLAGGVAIGTGNVTLSGALAVTVYRRVSLTVE